MRKEVRWALMSLILGICTVACGDGRDGEEALPSPAEGGEEEALRAARAESVAMAEARYDPAAFDTISWADAGARLERGELVFSYSCADCHGAGGAGDGETAVEHGLDMPDFNAIEWEYAGDVDAMRRRIYIGHESEMPTWGLYGLPYRDIDAVAYYIDQVFSSRVAEPD